MKAAASFASAWFLEPIAQDPAKQKEIHTLQKHLKPAINCITLPVDDLKKSLDFYRDGLGLPAQFSAELEDGADRTAFELAGDLWLVLMPRAEFAKCTKIAHQPDAPRGSSECILSYFAASKEDVDVILKRGNAAGGAAPGEAEDQPSGYSGYFTDPDGHLWEIMWKPALVGDATQANRKHGVAPEVGAISFMRVLPGPIEHVWAYLTELEKRGKWFASGPMELRAGGRVRRFSVPPEPVFDASSFPIKLRSWRSPHHRKTKMHPTL